MKEITFVSRQTVTTSDPDEAVWYSPSSLNLAVFHLLDSLGKEICYYELCQHYKYQHSPIVWSEE